MKKSLLLSLALAASHIAQSQTVPPGTCTSGGTPTRLAYQDFGSGAVKVAPAFAAGTTGYTYSSTPPGAGEYTVASTTAPTGAANTYPAWWGSSSYPQQLFDHTAGTNTAPYNYMAIFNSSGNTTTPFYTQTFSNLCAGTKLFFSSWVVSVVGDPTGYVRPNLNLVLTNPADNSVLLSINTGFISNADRTWKQFAGSFTLPAGVTSVKLSITDLQSGTTGNDFAIDDIEIWECKPTVSVTGNDTAGYCPNQAVSLSATVTDPNATYALGYDYQWYYSPDNITWSPATAVTSGTSTTNMYNFSASTATEGYYKVAVANEGSLSAGVLPANACGIVSAPVQVLAKDPSLCTPLPLTLVRFAGVRPSPASVKLSWTVANQTNTSSFIIERSSDGKNFTTSGTVAAAGNLETARDYSYTDENAGRATVYYRLKMTDVNGQFAYSAIATVAGRTTSGDAPVLTKVHPVPFQSFFRFSLNSAVDCNAVLRLYDTRGVMVHETPLSLLTGDHTYTVDQLGALAQGYYLAELTTGSGLLHWKIIK